MSNVYLLRIDSPIGRIELVGDDEHLVALTIEDADGALPHDDEPERVNAVLALAREQLTEYFAGTRTEFELPVKPAGGSDFQRAVWAELARLHWGEATTYGALAAAVGRPGSARAIGGAVGANPIPIVIGCHRVLASDGRITGYSGGHGIPTKLWLLGHEQIGFAA
ncbi:methylated-DNA--[protein]-cysteine S-methyltransferase [Agromyces mediolanus]|uniref:methylated-DNA--[protein]-cysteine S-methyltransferase n=1 Tax=Agromyces mediolanus TaxID=41986 RepID=UPI0020411D3F|nr:methylated-DNA--[protein]-cysteine S-methyltransferase [Agromyces mediolanus]MCM3656657.1 methylated-DNA--[protein]-cysteine S-methyltransferase [Agromyces mediolanus]